MNTLRLLPLACLLACTACAKPASEPKTATTEATPAESAAPPADAADTTPPTASAESSTSAPAPAATEPTRPSVVITPEAQLKKITGEEISAAAKLGKEGDDFKATLGKLRAKLGAPTFVTYVSKEEVADGDSYYWSALKPDGACEQLMIQSSNDGKAIHTIKTDSSVKGATLFHEKSELNPCSGQPRKK